MLFHISSRTIKIEIPIVEVIKLIFFKVLYLGYMILLPIYFLPISVPAVVLAFLLMHFIISLIFVGVLGVAHLSERSFLNEAYSAAPQQ
jgi:linoleoyl-CoA desaturase